MSDELLLALCCIGIAITGTSLIADTWRPFGFLRAKLKRRLRRNWNYLWDDIYGRERK